MIESYQTGIQKQPTVHLELRLRGGMFQTPFIATSVGTEINRDALVGSLNACRAKLNEMQNESTRLKNEIGQDHSTRGLRNALQDCIKSLTPKKFTVSQCRDP